MIVKHRKEGWEIISHYAHGLLAGKIASQLKKELRPAHWVDVLTAIVEHDDHQLNFDEKNHLTDKGTPKDFTMKGGSDAEALEHGKRVFSTATEKSQLVGLLVGRHLNFLYKSLAKEYKPMKDFLDEIGELRKIQRKLYGLSKKEEDALYSMLLFCDRCSLILCQDEIPEVGRKLEINKTIENNTYYISRTDNKSLTIEPWPFEAKSFALDLEFRMLGKIKFQSNAELERSFLDATIKMKSFSIMK